MRSPGRWRLWTRITAVLLASLVLLLVVVTPVVIYLLCLRSLRRSNRVSPRVPTFAPVTTFAYKDPGAPNAGSRAGSTTT